MKKIKPLIFLMMIGTSCFDSSEKNIVINEKILDEVAINIVDTLNDQRSCSYEFLTKMDIKSFINDTLYKPPIDTVKFKTYEASWIQKKDTILILGNDSRPDGAIGFNAEIIGNKINIYGYVRTHVLLSNLSNEPSGKMYNSILIPTKKKELIISKIPKGEKDIIGGFIEFETNDFYVFEDDENENPVVEDKIRFVMKMYFKASKCEKE